MKIYFCFLSVALIYTGILLRWIDARNNETAPEWLSGFEIAAIGALGLVILVVFSLASWIRHRYWTPAWLLPCFGISVHFLGSATEYVDEHNRLHESLAFLAGGFGFFVIGIGYLILLIIFSCSDRYNHRGVSANNLDDNPRPS